jgi:hypothetical protein
MKSPFLILFIIFNMLSINLVSASDWYDIESDTHILEVESDTVGTSSVDQSDCDHFCHISSHMVGIVTQVFPHLTTNPETNFFAQNELFTSQTLSPPIQPPIA